MRADMESGNPQWWRSHPWRLIQTNLREIDMQDIDAGVYVSELQSMDATIAMINTAGIIASYPTRLTDHFQSPYLTGDSLADIIDACHAAGIRVIARIDFSKVRRPIYDRHPDWAYRTRDREIVDYNGDVHACLNGGYQQEYCFRIMTEVLETLDIDGAFFNMGGFLVRDYSYNHYGPCHCENCRRRFFGQFRTYLDAALAPGASPDLTRLYELAKREWVREHEDRMHAHIHAIRPDVAVNHYEYVRQESNTEIGRPLPRWQYDASSNTRWVVTGLPGSISSSTSVDFIGFPYRHVAVSPAMQELRLWQDLANGGSVDFYQIGRLDNHRDRSGYERVRAVFGYHQDNEQLYAPGMLSSVARTLVISPRTGLAAEGRGWVRALTELHVPFDEAREHHLSGLDLSRYRVVILPDVEELSDRDCAKIDEWVRGGGCLVASGQSALKDERLEPRTRPGVDLGIAETIMVRDDLRSAMFAVDSAKGDVPASAVAAPGSATDPTGAAAPSDGAGSSHEPWNTLIGSGSDLVYLGDRYVYNAYRGDARGHLRLIPPHSYGPPERCYDTEITDLPGVVTRAHGNGRTVYLPWWPGALYHREGHLNTQLVIADVVLGLAQAPRLQTNLPTQVEASLHTVDAAAGGGLLLSLVNTSGHAGTTVHDPIPVTDIEITVPSGLLNRTDSASTRPERAPGAGSASPAGAQLAAALHGGAEVSVRADAKGITVRLPRLDFFEAIHISSVAPQGEQA